MIVKEITHPSIVEGFLRFRKLLFVDHLGWKIETNGNLERDQFDHDDAVYCLLYQDDVLVAGFRAIRTDHVYLARALFPALASLKDYPSQIDAWEISRFGVLPGHQMQRLAQINYASMLRFAHMQGATTLVALADRFHERHLRSLGIRTRRYGPPQVIGETVTGKQISAVAGEIPMNLQSGDGFATLMSTAYRLEMTDETLVLGRTLIQA